MDMPLYRTIKGKRIEGFKNIVDVEDKIAVDIPINIIINDEVFTTIYATPNDLYDLAVGFLLCEGLIDNYDDIRRIVVDDSNIRIDIDQELFSEIKKRYKIARLILTSCGALDDYIKKIGKLEPVKSSYSIHLGQIYSLIRTMNNVSINYKEYMALHTAAIFEDLSLKVVSSDVNRHITIDKVIGKAVQKNVDFDKSILITSGRLSADMILKAGRMGIPIGISLRGPLFSGIYMAMELSMTCIALTHGKGFTIYTSPERITS